ncbi:hypothetical protein [Nonomuraea sp. PA05]|uniref:hypothetical protein n=1 Tax=Nonomuraea sp. PA05 TaxID=2604466 RepID=UPI001651FBA7|nr:hypothetical protein [Nonomuraea sp. PA05]
MATGFVDASYQAFDECRTRVRTASQEFNLADILKDSKSKTPAERTDPTLFGMLNNVTDLTAQMDATWAAVRAEIESGRLKLAEVERALSDVETNLRTAAAASGA